MLQKKVTVLPIRRSHTVVILIGALNLRLFVDQVRFLFISMVFVTRFEVMNLLGFGLVCILICEVC